MVNAGQAVAYLTLDRSGYSTGLKSAYQELMTFTDGTESASNRIQSFGGSITGIGNMMTKSITVPLIGAGAMMTKFAMDYETSIAKVATIADTSVVSIDSLNKGIMNLSNDTGISASELSNTLYDTISAGIDTAKSVEFLAQTTKLAKAGFANTDDALSALTSTINAYGLEATEAERISDIFIQTQNLGVLTVGELSQSIGKIIPSANAAGVSVEQLSAGYVQLTKGGIKCAEATTYYNSMLNELTKTGSKSDKVLRELSGKGFKGLMEEGKTVADVLVMLNTYAEENNLTLADMFGSSEAAKAGLVLVKNAGEDFNKTLSELGDSTGATNKAFEIVSDTTEAKFTKALNEAKNASIELGSNLLPIATDAIEVVSDLAGKFNELDEASQRNIVAIGGMVAAAGPLMSIGGKLITGVGALVGLVGATPLVIGALGLATVGLIGHMEGLVDNTNAYNKGVAIMADGTIVKYSEMSEETAAKLDPIIQRLGTMHDLTGQGIEYPVKFNEQDLVTFYENSEAIITEYRNMNKAILEEEIVRIQASSLYSNEEKVELINQLKKYTSDSETEFMKHETRKKEIIETAARENRELTITEQMEMHRIENNQLMLSELSLAKSEDEKERIRAKYYQITKNQMQEHYDEEINSLKKYRDEQLKEIDSYNNEKQKKLADDYQKTISEIRSNENLSNEEKRAAMEEADRIYREESDNVQRKVNEAKAALRGEIEDAWIPLIETMLETGAVTAEEATEIIKNLNDIDNTDCKVEIKQVGGDYVISVADRVYNAISNIPSTKHVSIMVSQSGGGNLSMDRLATGTSNAMPGIATVAEFGAELIQSRNGTLRLATDRQITYLQGGEKVYNARQTQDILSNSVSNGNSDSLLKEIIFKLDKLDYLKDIARKEFNKVTENIIEKVEVNSIANLEEVHDYLVDFVESNQYGGL